MPFLAAPIPVGIFMLALPSTAARGMVPLIPGFDRGEWSRPARLSLFRRNGRELDLCLAHRRCDVCAQHQSRDRLLRRILSNLLGAWIRPTPPCELRLPVLSRAAQRDRSRLRYAVQRMLDGSVLGVLFALVTGFAADFLIDVVAGPKFKPSIPVLEIHAVALVGTFVAATLHSSSSSNDDTTRCWSPTCCSLVAHSPSARAWPRAKGAAWATVGGESALAAYAIARFLLEVGPPDFCCGRPEGCYCRWACGYPGLVPELNGAILAAAAAVIYLGVLALLRGIPSELWKGSRSDPPPAAQWRLALARSASRFKVGRICCTWLRVRRERPVRARAVGGAEAGRASDARGRVRRPRRLPGLFSQPWSSEIEWVRLPVRITNRTHLVAQMLALPALAARRSLDVLHSLANVGPPAAPGCPRRHPARPQSGRTGAKPGTRRGRGVRWEHFRAARLGGRTG